MRSVYLAMLATVFIFVMVFSVVNMSGEALFQKENAESLVSLPSHYRWGYGGYLSPAQYYNLRDQVGNLSGVARSELRSEDIAWTGPGLGIIDVFAVPNASIVYSGLNYVSGARTPGPGQVIAIRNSDGSSSLTIGQVVRANFTFYTGTTGGSNKYLSIARNFTIAGFADATVNGFGYLTNSEIGSPSGNLFQQPTLVANWDDLIPPIIDLVNSNHASTLLTQLVVYVKQSDFTSLDIASELSKAQSLQGQIQSTTSSIGGSTDSWLIDQIQQQQSQVGFYSSVAITVAAVALISCFLITDYLTSASINRAQSGNPISSTKADVDTGLILKHGSDWRILTAGSIGVAIGIVVSVLTVSYLVYSSVTGWTPTIVTLTYSVVYGVGLVAVVWFQSRDTLSKQDQRFERRPLLAGAANEPSRR